MLKNIYIFNKSLENLVLLLFSTDNEPRTQSDWFLLKWLGKPILIPVFHNRKLAVGQPSSIIFKENIIRWLIN